METLQRHTTDARSLVIELVGPIPPESLCQRVCLLGDRLGHLLRLSQRQQSIAERQEQIAALGLVVRVQHLLHLDGLIQQPCRLGISVNGHGTLRGHLAVGQRLRQVPPVRRLGEVLRHLSRVLLRAVRVHLLQRPRYRLVQLKALRGEDLLV